MNVTKVLGLEKQENQQTKCHMADRPTTSRVGRPRARSVHPTPRSTAKVGTPRSKSVQKPKAKGSGKKTTVPTKRVVRPLLQLEWDMVEANQRPFGDQLPDLPPLDLEQSDNISINPPNQPLYLPVGEENQQNQAEKPNEVPNPPPEQEEPDQPDQIDPPNLPPNQPNQPNQPFLPTQMAQPHQLNWAYFKPEFSGKPEEDAEAHLPRTNDWMEAHNCEDDQKVRRFCLTLAGEARLWYETLGAAQLDWDALQDCF